MSNSSGVCPGPSKKRYVWNNDAIVEALQIIGDNHDFFKAERKRGKARREIYEDLNKKYINANASIDDLLKNLSKEYREVIKKTVLSGEGTEDPILTLRGSSEVYQLYDRFEKIYSKKGSAIAPAMIVTEEGVTTIASGSEPEQPRPKRARRNSDELSAMQETAVAMNRMAAATEKVAGLLEACLHMYGAMNNVTILNEQ